MVHWDQSQLVLSPLLSFTKLLYILKGKVYCLQSFASQLKQNNSDSIVTHELFSPPVFICLFVWQQVIKRYLKINRDCAVTHVRDRNPKKKTALRRKEKKQKTFYCNKMNNKKIKNWDFSEAVAQRPEAWRSTLKNN